MNAVWDALLQRRKQKQDEPHRKQLPAEPTFLFYLKELIWLTIQGIDFSRVGGQPPTIPAAVKKIIINKEASPIKKPLKQLQITFDLSGMNLINFPALKGAGCRKPASTGNLFALQNRTARRS